MARVPLVGHYGEGNYAIVDDTDLDLVSQYRWRMSGNGYVHHSRNGDHSRTIAHVILGIDPSRELQPDHIDRDKLNNRRCNLRVATPSEQMRNRSYQSASGVRHVRRGSTRFKGQVWIACPTGRPQKTFYDLGEAEAYTKGVSEIARVKYDVRGVEGKRVVLPASVYNVKVASAEITKPEGKDERIEVTFEVIGDKTHNGAKLYEYINVESEAARWKLREFLEAVGVISGGKGESGTLDTAKLLGKKLGVKTFVRPADDTRGFDEQARIRRMFEAENGASADVEEDLDESEDEDESDYQKMELSELKAELAERGLSTKGKRQVLVARLLEDDEQEEDEEEEGEDYTWDDLVALSRAELRQLNKDEELGVKIVKSKDDDTVRAEVAGALDIDVPEVDEEEAEDESEDDYDEWTDDELKEELSQRSLATKGSTRLLLSRLRKDDAEEEKPF